MDKLSGNMPPPEALQQQCGPPELLHGTDHEKSLILDSMTELFAYYDLDMRFIWANRTAVAAFKRPLESVTGRLCHEIWQETDQPCQHCPVIKARTTGEPQEGEIQTPDGRIWHLRGYPVFNEAGQLIALAEFGQDVTQRKEHEKERVLLQEQLRQAQKMESIGRLASGVAHDFNNLLTGIKGNIDLARMDMEADDIGAVLERLEEADKAAQSAAQLTRQLLAFCRKQVIEPQVINLNRLIDNMHRMLTRLIGEDVQFSFIPAPDLGDVLVDPGQMEQVIVNLVVNARDAMPTGGRLQIETGNLYLGGAYCRAHAYAHPGEYVMMAVSDTGHGMSEDTQEQAFDPFFTTKPAGEGTGLGLSTVYGAIKQNGGIIELKSAVEQGTTFLVYLPRSHVAEEKQSKRKARRIMPAGNETVLLVEDDPVVLAMTTRVLKRLGYEVLPHESPKEALAAAKEHNNPIQMLVSDVIMPEMNGNLLAQQLQQILPDLHVLFMSGYTDDVIAHHGVLGNSVHFIGKPFTPQELAEKVRGILGAGLP